MYGHVDIVMSDVPNFLKKTAKITTKASATNCKIQKPESKFSKIDVIFFDNSLFNFANTYLSSDYLRDENSQNYKYGVDYLIY